MLKGIILATALISFTLCVFLTKQHTSFSFYMLPTRYWELCFGSLAAVGFIKKPQSIIFAEFLSFFGVVLILFSIFTFSSSTIFPGYMALIPVLGATLIIVNAEDTFVGKLLSTKPFVFVGLISYSLYLWHWPLIVFSRDKYIVDIMLSKELIVLLSFIMAWLSTKYVESPFRNRINYDQRKIYKYSSGMYLIAFLAALIIWPLNGWPDRLSDDKLKILSAVDDISPVRNDCHFNDGLPAYNRYCKLSQGLTNNHADAKVLVWGDSHGAEIAYSLSKEINLYAVTYSACPPALGYQASGRLNCSSHNNNVINFIKENKDIRTVILAANYNLYNDARSSNGFTAEFASTIERLRELGRNVLVLDQVPSPGVDVPHFLINSTKIRNEKFEYNNDVFREIKISPGVKIFRYQDYMCNNNMCNMIFEGIPISFDDNHLSLHVSMKMAKYIVEDINSMAATN
ncbi:O-acetyltransferase OatA [Klebsiella spallanzanii]|uniref:O-acetyltransferase OatA n=2 Tax=Klebsiella spallanzanii TaxID=2587528 RepID=A0ABY6VKK6_9ENTR|nr:O-acetyltransferase OatA [Klebsiella spallanzanii]